MKIIHPVGALIDDVRNKTPEIIRILDKKGFMKRGVISNGKKVPYHGWIERIVACIRILRDRGMVVYYKEDE